MSLTSLISIVEKSKDLSHVFLNHMNIVQLSLEEDSEQTLDYLLKKISEHDRQVENEYDLLVLNVKVLDCFLVYAKGIRLDEYLTLFWEAVRRNIQSTVCKNRLNNLLPAIGYRAEKYGHVMIAPTDIMDELMALVDSWESLPDGANPSFTGGSQSNEDKKAKVEVAIKQLRKS